MAPSSPFAVLHPQAAGIDCGAYQHAVCVGDNPDTDIRFFETYTDQLRALADWLAARGITTVAMESTGIYWIALFELLSQRGFQVILVDPRQTRRPGRPKTDRLDCQWIRRLHACGLLQPAFRPADFICTFRGYLRCRLTIVRDASRYIQHMQKALEQMNVKLTEVVSSIVGVTGLLIIRAILKGERRPQRLAQFRDRHCKHNEATFARALEGNWRDEHLFALKQAVQAWDFCQRQLHDCDHRIKACLDQMPKKRPDLQVPPQARSRGRKPNDPIVDIREVLAQVAGVDLTAIEGIDLTVAMTLLAEIGINMDAFPTEKHLGSWLGLAPKAKSSGKRRRDRICPGAQRAAHALRLAAVSLFASKSALGAFFRRLRGRLGAPKAITATAYKLARLVWRLLKHGAEYVKRGMAEYEAQFRDRMVKALKRKAHDFGFELVAVTPEAAAATTP